MSDYRVGTTPGSRRDRALPSVRLYERVRGVQEDATP